MEKYAETYEEHIRMKERRKKRYEDRKRRAVLKGSRRKLQHSKEN